MSEIVVETTPTETVIEIEGGPVLTTTVEQELQTVIEVPSDPVVIDLNSGARGEPGSAIHTGAAYPASMIGQDGDLYVVTDGSVQAGFVFLKENGVWEQQGSIRGPAGGIDVVNGYTGPIVTLVKGDVGLANVDNTRDADKPISTATATALAGKISNNEILKKTDPFFGNRNVYLPELHNGLFRADVRFNVVAKLYDSATNAEVSTLSTTEVARFFDGNYDNSYTVPNGRYMLVTITFPNESGGWYPGYPYGDFIISTYYQGKPSATPAVRFFTDYAAHGGPAWKTLTPSILIDTPSNYAVKFNNQNYQISQMEFRVDSPASGTTAKVTQIEMNPDRPGVNESPVVDKYKVNSLYSNTQWKGTGGAVQASITTGGVITGSSFVGSGASLTALNGSSITTGTVADARLSTNVLLINSSQTVTGTKTFTPDTYFTGKIRATANTETQFQTDWALGQVAGDVRITRRHTHSGGTNQFHIIDLMHRRAAGNDWVTAQLYQGVAVDTSFLESPTTGNPSLALRVWMLRDPQNQVISFGSGLNTYLSLSSAGLVGNGSGLTSLNGSNISTGTVADARLSTNVMLLNGVQTVTGAKTFTGEVVVPTPTASNHAATKGYIDSIVDAAPGTLDTLNELAAALGDDPNFATTVTNSIATKEPIINAGTTAQYWRGDKTWQTLDKSAVGLSLINNVAQVEIAGAQTITGAKTFSGATVFSGTLSADGATNLRSVGIKPVGDHGYVSFYSRDAAPSTRTAYVGVGSAGSVDFTIANEMTNGNIRLTPNGTGAVVITSGGLTVTGTITGSGSGITAINGSNIASGTVADARLSTNVALLAGTQTFSGAKTFSALITASAGVTVTGTVTATTFSGSGASLTSIPAGNLTGTVAQARLVQNITRVVHGATASTARPTGATYVEWIGSVVPTNMATNDTWINTATNGNTSDNRPAGSVMASASAKSTAPAGWYWMEGQEILISGDTALYNELTNNGTTFPYGANTNGSGAAGSTHFRLPNSKGKVIAHADGTTEFAAVGTSFGTKTVTLTAAQSGVPAHNHGVSDPGHYHSGSTSTAITYGINRVMSAAGSSVAGNHGVGYGGGIVTDLADGSQSLWSAHIHTFDTNVVGTGVTTVNNTTQNASQSHNNIQPTLTLRYMIKR